MKYKEGFEPNIWASLSISAGTFPLFFRPRLISVCSGGGFSFLAIPVIRSTMHADNMHKRVVCSKRSLMPNVF